MIKQRAYLLHSRPYKETSALVDFFTPDYGHIRCMARGVKKANKHQQPLQPFTLYTIFFHGDSGLKNLDKFEASSLPLSLSGNPLFSGFYINEVLLRALRSDAEVESQSLFDAYEDVLASLNSESLELSLRLFELSLLEHMGQQYEWALDFRTESVVEDDAFYGFFVEQGMARVSQKYAQSNPNAVFRGHELKALSHGELLDENVLKMCKRLFRLALRPIIGYKPIQARELLKQFQQLDAINNNR